MKQVNVKKLILPNIPYVFIALLATKVSEAVRLAPGSDASTKLLNIMTGLNTAFHSLVPSFHPIDLCVGVAAAIAIRLAVYIKGKNAKKFRKNLEYGSARWGTAEDIKPYVDPAFENNIILTQTERLTMNSRPKDPKTARNKNVLIVGGSGSGKTRFWLKPNLLQCTSKTYPTSFVVTDPKGDIVVSCGHALQKNGYQIKILNSLNFKKSMHYNPFAYIHSEKDILKLVTTLIANTKGEGKAGDDFWVKAETLLYTALIGYIHYEAPMEEQNFSTLIEFINAMEVREDDEDFKNPVDLMFDELKKRKPDHFAVRQYAKFKLSAGKTAKSILISCGARLAPFDIQELRELTAYDELQLDTLGDRKTALFIIMSDTDDTFNFLISMCYTQLFNLLCEKADDVYGGRLPVHVRCLIDEAANIGQIPRLEKLVATIRSREISCCLVLQAQSQLKALYKDSADTIIGNMDCSIFLGGKEPGTLKELAAALGKETIDSYNTGESRGREVSHSLNYQKLGKELMSVDELAVLDVRQKLIDAGMPPEQIAFIHDANTEVKKRELFAKVRSGQVRVLMGSTAKMGAGTNVQDRLVALHDLDCPWRPRDLTQRKGRIERQGNQNKLVHVCRYVTEGTFDAYLWQTVENKQKFISQIMTSKSPVRSCEDVDATALSFAEIKALCAGDPRIKERMDLDIEVSKLKIMKADHNSKQFRLEDSLLKYFPEKIEEHKGFVRGLEADMQTLAAHPLPAEGFVGMEIRGDRLTDKENAGAALLDTCKEVKGKDPVQIGSYRGFTMSVAFDSMWKTYTLTLKGRMTHRVELGSDARGNLVRIENALDKMPERLRSVQEQLENLYNQQAAAKAEVGKPFPQEQELAAKTARLIELDMELNLDGKGQPQPEQAIAKSARPSVLNRLKAPPVHGAPEKPHKKEMEAR